MTEHQHAVHFANYLRRNGYFFHHSPNETFTKFDSQKRKNSLEGVSPGYPDYCIILKRGSLLFIELKKARGPRGGMNGSKISDAQKSWINRLHAVDNIEARFAFGFEDAVRIVEECEVK